MTIKKGEWFLIIFNLAYIISFLIYYIGIKNFEFLGYIFVMLILFGLVFTVQRKVGFSYPVLWGLTIWGLLHMAGGSLKIGENRLYGLGIIPIWVNENFYVLRFDQFVHFYLYFVMVFVIWQILKNNLKSKPNYLIIYIMIALTSIGIGALNEIIEFVLVLTLTNTGVGGYYNTAWDIVFNSLGTLLGVIVLWIVNRKDKF